MLSFSEIISNMCSLPWYVYYLIFCTATAIFFINFVYGCEKIVAYVNQIESFDICLTDIILCTIVIFIPPINIIVLFDLLFHEDAFTEYTCEVLQQCYDNEYGDEDNDDENNENGDGDNI